MYERTKRDKDEQAEQLAKMLTNFMNDIQLENSKLEQKIHENELRKNIKYEYSPPIQKQVDRETVTTESYVPNRPKPTPNYETKRQTEDVIETSLEGQVLQLHREGKTVSEIAKQLSRGKTEVDLLIKLNRKANN